MQLIRFFFTPRCLPHRLILNSIWLYIHSARNLRIFYCNNYLTNAAEKKKQHNFSSVIKELKKNVFIYFLFQSWNYIKAKKRF